MTEEQKWEQDKIKLARIAKKYCEELQLLNSNFKIDIYNYWYETEYGINIELLFLENRFFIEILLNDNFEIKDYIVGENEDKEDQVCIKNNKELIDYIKKCLIFKHREALSKVEKFKKAIGFI